MREALNGFFFLYQPYNLTIYQLNRFLTTLLFYHKHFQVQAEKC